MNTPIATLKEASAWSMYRSLVGIGMICALIIVAVFAMTMPIIKHNKAVALDAAINKVLPRAHTKVAFELTAAGHFVKLINTDSAQDRIYATYDVKGQLLGFAIQAQGMGYQDVIELIYAYDSDSEAIIGMQVLASRETPGLGDKIRNDVSFLENFKRLDVALNSERNALAHPLEVVKTKDKRHAWQIDAITGATISSQAIGKILSHSVAFWMPLIINNLEDFKRGDQT